METVRDAKFNVKGKVRVVQGTVSQTNTGSLAMILAVIGENGKPDSKTYDLLDKKWSKVKAEAKGWWQSQFDFRLGNLHQSAVQSDTWVMHLLCVNKEGVVDEKALASCLKKLTTEAQSNRASIHVSSALVDQVPQLGDQLQGLVDAGINCFLYKEAEPVVAAE